MNRRLKPRDDWGDRTLSVTHTPAPWTAERDPCHFDTFSSIRAGDGVLRIEVGGKAGLAEQEANTRLIASAPDYAAAAAKLAALVDGYRSQMKFCDIEALGYFREFVRRVEGTGYAAAIAKAAGQ